MRKQPVREGLPPTQLIQPVPSPAVPLTSTTLAAFIPTDGIRFFLIWEGFPCLWPGEHTLRVRPRSLPAVSSATRAHSVGSTLYFNCFYLLGVFVSHCQPSPSPDCHQLVPKPQQSPAEPWSTCSSVSCTPKGFTWQNQHSRSHPTPSSFSFGAGRVSTNPPWTFFRTMSTILVCVNTNKDLSDYFKIPAGLTAASYIFSSRRKHSMSYSSWAI